LTEDGETDAANGDLAESERRLVRDSSFVREAAMRLLARREHGRIELVRKLAGRGHPPQLAKDVVADLATTGLQSDDRFVASFVRSALGRGHGPLKIRAGLRDRGIDDDTAWSVLPDDEWTELARNAVDKRFGPSAPKNRAEWAKRARFLAGRGFPSDVAGRVLGSLDQFS